MKNLILFLIPLLFLGCKKDELPIEVSEGTRLVKKEIYVQETSLNEYPDGTKYYYYNEDGKIIRMELYLKSSLNPSHKTEKEYDELGNLTLMKFFAARGSDSLTLISFNEIYINPVNQLIEKISLFSIREDTGIPEKTAERNLVYDEHHQIILDTVTSSYMSGSHSGRPVNFRYFWEDGNVVKVERFDLDEKLVQGILIDHNNSKNYRTWDLMRYTYSPYSDIIPKGKNNISKTEYFDFGLIIPRRLCNPCRTTYKYNSFGLPYYSSSNGGERKIFTYERE